MIPKNDCLLTSGPIEKTSHAIPELSRVRMNTPKI